MWRSVQGSRGKPHNCTCLQKILVPAGVLGAWKCIIGEYAQGDTHIQVQLQ